MEPQAVDLAHFSLNEREIQHALGRVKVRDVDYADIYIESTIRRRGDVLWRNLAVSDEHVHRGGRHIR